jgi:uncharacterized membrane protein
VIVTVMVLELKTPDQPAFLALWPFWPTAISYVVSYLFVAIIWINRWRFVFSAIVVADCQSKAVPCRSSAMLQAW